MTTTLNTDVYRADPARIVCGMPEEQPAFPHGELPPVPDVKPHPPRNGRRRRARAAGAAPTLDATAILKAVRQRRAELAPLVAEHDRLVKVLEAWRDI